jgi:Big-like domain-containing protein
MRRRAVVACWTLVAIALLVPLSVTLASFSSGTTSSSSITSAPDFVAPTVDRSVIGRIFDCSPGVPGSIRQGYPFYVYANVTETGNPPSGVTSVTADVSSVATGQTAVPLASGSFSTGGVSYNRRSASITPNATITPGQFAYTVRTTDAAGNAATQTGFTITVDNTQPTASDVQTANGSGTAALPDTGDTITLLYSEPVVPCTILSGWSGSSTSVVVRMNGKNSNDQVTIWNASDTAQLALGMVEMGSVLGDYLANNLVAEWGATGTPSTMVMSGSQVVITLGTRSGSAPHASNGADRMVWTPSTTPTDPAGNPCTATAATESGTNDTDF